MATAYKHITTFDATLTALITWQHIQHWW